MNIDAHAHTCSHTHAHTHMCTFTQTHVQVYIHIHTFRQMVELFNGYSFLRAYFCACLYVVSVWMDAMRAGASRDQPEEGIGSETGVPVSGSVWMLGNELGSPARAVHALNYWAFSAVPESGGLMLQDAETSELGWTLPCTHWALPCTP